MATQTTKTRVHGCDTVLRFLDQHGVNYEIARHERTADALAEARAYGAPPRRMMKTVALKSAARFLSVCLPAPERLDLTRARHLLGDRDARLATEDELEREYPALEAGAMPPFGGIAPPLEFVDRGVLAFNWVIANAGDGCHSVRLSPLEIVRLARARVVDIAHAR
jgi:Ala-tRNA(Pro) deacylase